jgi:Tfp pilus assembly protein PilP
MRDISEPEAIPETISKTETHEPTPEIKKASTEVEKIGDKIVKVQFIEYIGKRKKKVTHIEVKEAELDEMLANSDKPIQVQYSLF